MTGLRKNKLVKSFILLFLLTGCASYHVAQKDPITPYQESIAQKGPQERIDTEGQDAEIPAGESSLPPLQVIHDEINAKSYINLSLEEAVVRTLANSPEIRIVSVDPSIAQKDIVRAVSGFDVNFFSKVEYDRQDNPTDSLFQGGQTESRLAEAGLKQRVITGAEWQLTYALSRSWDDLISRSIDTRFEPVLFFQLRQPLLRDAWMGVNLSDVNISKLNYRASLASFRQRSEDLLTNLISLYWTLIQARHDYEVQQWLLEKTNETLNKLEGRRNIDATILQIKQAESTLKSRKAILLQAGKRLSDIQDELIRLLSDNQLNLFSDFDILTTTKPETREAELIEAEIIDTALKLNPRVQQASFAVEVADINLSLARRQKAPKLDLVASTRVQGLADSSGAAHEMFYDTDYTSYSIGVTFEYPIGNREKRAVYEQRRLEQSKAVSTLQNVSDIVTTEARERIRFADRAFEEMQVQKEAADAAEIYLQALEDLEIIREKLTPEFLLVKLQAQEALADARRSEVKGMIEYNIALVRVAQSAGTVLDLGFVRAPLNTVSTQ